MWKDTQLHCLDPLQHLNIRAVCRQCTPLFSFMETIINIWTKRGHNSVKIHFSVTCPSDISFAINSEQVFWILTEWLTVFNK